MNEHLDILERCKQLDFEGRVDLSIGLLSESIQNSPSSDLYFERGCRYEDIGQFGLAEDDYSYSIRINPKSKYFIARGLLSSNKNSDHESGLRDFQNALAIEPGDANTYVCISLTYLSLGKLQRALENARIGVELAPQVSDSHSCLGQCLLAANQLSEAANELHTATVLAPAAANSWSILSRVYRKLKRFNEAKVALERAIDFDPSISNQISYGSLLFELDEYPKAIHVFEEASKGNLTEVQKVLIDGYLGLAKKAIHDVQ